MGPLLALAIGAAIGGVARLITPRHVPRRADVTVILAAVGALLGALGLSISSWNWDTLSRASKGTALASATGAVAILLAFDVLPRIAPDLTVKLPGRDDQPAA